jgi:hypothetical protein
VKCGPSIIVLLVDVYSWNSSEEGEGEEEGEEHHRAIGKKWTKETQEGDEGGDGERRAREVEGRLKGGGDWLRGGGRGKGQGQT